MAKYKVKNTTILHEYKPVTVYTDPLTGKRVAPDVGWSHNPASGLIEGN